jgi:glycosyltransferase involved in cell wall biosynthesis
MNGGMAYPPGFSERQHPSEKIAHRAARGAANVANLLIPGKRLARLLLVANGRTRAALPSVLQSVPVEELVENGVDLEKFSPRQSREADDTLRLAFVGRLVGWKGVDILLSALGRARASCRVALEVFGDGPLRADLERRATELRLNGDVKFHGFLRQDAIAARLRRLDALVLPSLFECGGAVVLEAMAMALPVIATRWGGPADYLDDRCGILVDPESPEQMARDLAEAMCRLSRDHGLADAMGRAGRDKVQDYDWHRKIDRIMTIYQGVVAQSEGAGVR